MGEDPEKTKKILLFSIIGVVVFAVILIIILAVTSSISASRNNMIVNGEKSKIEEGIITVDELGNTYFSIEKMAPILSYEFYNGEYGKATEERTNCYVKTENEVAMFEINSNVIYKLLLKDANALYEKYTITLPVKRINDKLYTSLQGLQRAFNISAAYDAEKNVLTVYTLPYLYSTYNGQAKSLGYTSLAEEFSNQKALLNGLMVVVKDREYYGVVNMDGQTVIGTKYKKIEYMEDTSEFMVQNNGKFGVVTKEGTTKVDTTYDELRVIENEVGLYLVKSNNKYGILRKDGNVLLYLQYDYIGVKDKDSFPSDNIKNPYILLDSYIPVTKDGKIGFYGLDGTAIIEPSRLTNLGCISTTNKNEAYKNVLIIPESEGTEAIVVGVATAGTTNTVTYGLYSLQQKKSLTPTTYQRIYREIVNGEESYYMVFGGSITTVRSKLNTNSSQVNNGGTTVNVNPLVSDPVNNTTNGLNTISAGSNTILTPTNTTNTPTTNTTPTPTTGATNTTGTTNTATATTNGNSGVRVIDPNSTEPIVIQ